MQLAVFELLHYLAQRTLIGAKAARLIERKTIAPAEGAPRRAVQHCGAAEEQPAPRAFDAVVRAHVAPARRADGYARGSFNWLFTDAAVAGKKKREESVGGGAQCAANRQ